MLPILGIRRTRLILRIRPILLTRLRTLDPIPARILGPIPDPIRARILGRTPVLIPDRILIRIRDLATSIIILTLGMAALTRGRIGTTRTIRARSTTGIGAVCAT